MTTTEIAWLAGLLEGEGSFLLSMGNRERNHRPIIQVKMTDEDIIRKAAGLMKGPVYGPYRYPSSGPNAKPAWMTTIRGKKAAGWMMTLFTFMGKRRRLSIKKVLDTGGLRA